MASGPILHVDTTELKKLTRQLEVFARKAMPYAQREYINSQAFEAQRLWKAELPQKMKLRSKYTEQSIRVEKAKGLNTKSMLAVVGSIAPYMDEQEGGATEPKKGVHGVPIPAASPGRRKKRGKLSKAKQFKALNILPRVKGHRSRQVAASLHMAAKRGGPQYAFLQLRKNRMGIYLLDPGKRKAIKKVWDLSRPSITIPKNPTMEPAIQHLERMRPRLWQQALVFQLRKHKLFGWG